MDLKENYKYVFTEYKILFLNLFWEVYVFFLKKVNKI